MNRLSRSNPNNPDIVVAGSNDYCAQIVNGDLWTGYYRSTDGGATWANSLVPGYPDDDLGGRNRIARARCLLRGGRPDTVVRHRGPPVLRLHLLQPGQADERSVYVATYADDGASYLRTVRVEPRHPIGRGAGSRTRSTWFGPDQRAAQRQRLRGLGDLSRSVREQPADVRALDRPWHDLLREPIIVDAAEREAVRPTWRWDLTVSSTSPTGPSPTSRPRPTRSTSRGRPTAGWLRPAGACGRPHPVRRRGLRLRCRLRRWAVRLRERVHLLALLLAAPRSRQTTPACMSCGVGATPAGRPRST